MAERDDPLNAWRPQASDHPIAQREQVESTRWVSQDAVKKRQQSRQRHSVSIDRCSAIERLGDQAMGQTTAMDGLGICTGPPVLETRSTYCLNSRAVLSAKAA